MFVSLPRAHARAHSRAAHHVKHAPELQRYPVKAGLPSCCKSIGDRLDNCFRRSGQILYRTRVPADHLQGVSTLSLGGPVHDYAQVHVEPIYSQGPSHGLCHGQHICQYASPHGILRIASTDTHPGIYPHKDDGSPCSCAGILSLTPSS